LFGCDTKLGQQEKTVLFSEWSRFSAVITWRVRGNLAFVFALCLSLNQNCHVASLLMELAAKSHNLRKRQIGSLPVAMTAERLRPKYSLVFRAFPWGKLAAVFSR